MRRRMAAIAAVSVLVSGLGITSAGAAPGAPTAPAAPTQEAGDDNYDVYVGKLDPRQLATLRETGIDLHETDLAPAPDGTADVEVVLSDDQAAELQDEGVDLELKETEAGASAAELATRQAATGYEVFRTYGGPGGLKEEFEQLAADNPDIVKLVTIGQTLNGQDIVAVKITKRANQTRDGRRPATLYVSAQHAREWITPEMNRRLAHHFVDNYGVDPTITDLIDRTELWIVPVANPDGYDFTFEPGQRLWRKNLRDNNGDGVIAPGDGVDLNRNFDTRWGYDNEGSSPDFPSETYRGTAPSSEPETQALDGLFERIDFEFLVNYHSAAQLLLWGTGWQVSTPTPDDAVYQAMAGDDANPAVPGYDPDISAELYTTNGDTTDHAHGAYGTLAFTPEMSTCTAASESVPDDEWDPAACTSDFIFPDDEELVQAEFAKNIPFAVATAQSALDPDDPVSVVGLESPDFVVDSFDVSYGDPQTVAVTARRAQVLRWMTYRINGGFPRFTLAPEWRGGERYGDDNDVYYAEYRGRVFGARPGDTVEVQFTGLDLQRGLVKSEPFTYTVADDSGSDVLVIADEDVTGVNPVYPAGTTGPKYLDEYTAALDANGISHDTWDIDSQGVPHPLGVLGHYDAVIWESGDDRLTQDPEDEITETFQGGFRDLSVAEKEQYLTLALRDYLNEGGKLLQAGETAGYFGPNAGSLGGIYYGLDGAPEEQCVVTSDFFSDCLLLADDFHQYYLGAYAHTSFSGPAGIEGTGPPLEGATAVFGGPATVDNPLDEAGAFALTSDALPPDEFPQFGNSTGSSTYVSADGTSPFSPIEGAQYAGAVHVDSGYQRLGQTIDLSGLTAADVPTLEFQRSHVTELGYDFVIVEAAPSGTDDWTTLPDVNGGTTTQVPADCEQGFLLELHPFLETYLTPGNPCTPVAPGSWNMFTGDSGGWQQAAVDLSAYAGGSVDVKISYVTDPAVAGIGAFVDDTRVTTTAGELPGSADGFEGATSLWTPEGSPTGSPPNASDWQIGGTLVEVAASVTTEDSVLLGYGIEQLSTPAEQADVLGRIMNYLLA